MAIKICETCGKEYKAKGRIGKFCSRSCYCIYRHGTTTDQEKEFVARYLAGESACSIARSMNMTHTVVLNALERNNCKRRSRYSYRDYTLDETVFDIIDTEEKAYWLGFLYADGYVRLDGLCIRLKPSDHGHIEKFCSFCNSNTTLRPGLSPNGNTLFATFHSKHLVTRLLELGIVPYRGTFNRILAAVPKHFYHHLARGLIDGDGYITRKDTKYVPNIGFVGQLDVVNWMKDLLVLHTSASKKIEPRQRKGVAEIAYGGRYQIKRIAEWLYGDANIYLDRKKALADYWRNAVCVS